MRRVSAISLAVLGVLLIVAAGLIKWVFAPSLIKAPLVVDRTTIATSSAQVFVLSAQTTKTVDVTATRSVRGDKSAGTGSVAVYDESLCLHGPGTAVADKYGCVPSTDPTFIQKTTDRVAFGRKSGLAVSDDGRFGTNVDGNKKVTHDGIGYTFPIDTKKKTYPFFDTVVSKSYPMRYVDSEKLAGLTVYKFTQDIPKSDIKINGVLPGSYVNVRTVWVEPTTGVIVKGSEAIEQRFTSGNGVAFVGTLVFTDATVKSQADFAKDQLGKIHTARLWLPIGAAVVGLILLGVGIGLSATGGRREPRRQETLA
ncbi:MAG: hypothetical protein JWM76_70 [Pseudonocardiales bacterium]|nr:hypothetical protein [Pseudonocardiales bacterium]